MRAWPAESWFVIGVLVVLGLVGLKTGGMGGDARLLPLVLVGTGIPLAAARLVVLLRQRAPGEEERQSGVGDASSSERFLAGSVLVIGFLVATRLVGFLISVPLFVLVVLRREGTAWTQAVAISVGTGLFVYVVFEFVFDIELYRGLLDF